MTSSIRNTLSFHVGVGFSSKPLVFPPSSAFFIQCSMLVSLPTLDHLPNLVRLNIFDCDVLEALPTSFGRKDGFLALVRFDLQVCDKLASLPKLEDGAIICLKYLCL
uniref:Uncharacterized protein n=1 Tax=Physcomitrium patens TaxID=3218 RepID=A0A7I3ZUY0_PHYPA